MFIAEAAPGRYLDTNYPATHRPVITRYEEAATRFLSPREAMRAAAAASLRLGVPFSIRHA